MGLWVFYLMLHSLMVPMFKSIYFMILHTYERRFYFSMKIYTLIYKLASFHANQRTWLFHGLSGTMCGSLHQISEKSYQYKNGTWDIPSRSVEKSSSIGLFKGCGNKNHIKVCWNFECSSKECLKYGYFEWNALVKPQFSPRLCPWNFKLSNLGRHGIF